MLNPADSPAAAPAENDLLRATGRQAWHQAPLLRADFSVAQLPTSPTFKPDKQKETPSKTPPSPAIEKPLDQPVPAKAPKTSGSMVNVRTYGLTRSDLEKAIAGIGKEGGCLYFSSGHWDIDADLTIPDRAAVKFDRGALLSVATQKGTGRLSHADESCAGTISVADGSTQVTGAATEFSKLRSGQFITCAGQRREIRHVADNTHLEVWTPFQPAISGKDFSKSSYIIKGSGTKFNSELEVGDFLYLGKEKHIVTSISGPDALTVAETPKNTFSEQPFTRSARVKILGSLEAGLYQIFSGQGVVKFAPGTVTSVHPEWWGAKGNGGSAMAGANSDAIEKALHSVMGYTKAVVALTNGRYFINRPIVILSSNSLIGQGTHIILMQKSNCPMVKDCLPLRGTGGGTIKSIFFDNGLQDAGYNGIHFVNNNKGVLIENCGFVSYTKHPGGYAIYLNVSGSTVVKGNFIYGFQNGIYAYGFDSFYINNEIMPTGDYAIYLIGNGNIVQGNTLYGDSGCKVGIFSKATFNIIIGNRIGPFDYGIKIPDWGGLITGNLIITNRLYGIYSNSWVKDAQITDNKFVNNAGYGLYFKSNCPNSVIKNNTFTDNNGGKANPQMMMDVPNIKVPNDQGFDEPLVEDNNGVDLQCAYPILAPNSTPNIRISKRWKTANISPTVITDFLGGCRGKEILVIFKDSHTSLKFSGPSQLKGHSGVDWRPMPGDHLRAFKGDEGSWYCECFSNHP